MVRLRQDVQRRKFGVWAIELLTYLARTSAYWNPRSDRFASPPILPETLYSLSPCYRSKTLVLDRFDEIAKVFKYPTEVKGPTMVCPRSYGRDCIARIRRRTDFTQSVTLASGKCLAAVGEIIAAGSRHHLGIAVRNAHDENVLSVNGHQRFAQLFLGVVGKVRKPYELEKKKLDVSHTAGILRVGPTCYTHRHFVAGSHPTCQVGN